jgi:hypothetical protein
MKSPQRRSIQALYLPPHQECGMGNTEEIARREAAQRGSEALAKAIWRYFDRRNAA